MARYFRGTTVRCSATFTDVAGGRIDPTEVVFRVRRPASSRRGAASVSERVVVRDGVGEYHADVQADVAGEWVYRFDGSGNVSCAVEKSLTVLESSF